MEISDNSEFGFEDTSYREAGQEEGLRQLCIDFYDFMETLPEAKRIREMHQGSLEVMVEKLALFLCGWLGGPSKYREKYGPIHIPQAHQHLEINMAERDAWLLCMKKAVEKQNYSFEFKEYLHKQFLVPAERIRKTSLSG
jgi:hemoglobin